MFPFLALFLGYNGSHFIGFYNLVMGEKAFSTLQKIMLMILHLVLSACGAVLIYFMIQKYFLFGFIFSALFLITLSYYKLYEVVFTGLPHQIKFILMSFLFWPACLSASICGVCASKARRTESK